MLGESYFLIFFIFIIFSTILISVLFNLENYYYNSIEISKNLYKNEEIKNLLQEISYCSDILKNDSEKISNFLNFLFKNSNYQFLYFSIDFNIKNLKLYNYLESIPYICIFCNTSQLECLSLAQNYSTNFEECQYLSFEINILNKKFYENITKDFNFYNIFFIMFSFEDEISINKIIKKYNL